jgi:hypothetical protein
MYQYNAKDSEKIQIMIEQNEVEFIRARKEFTA